MRLYFWSLRGRCGTGLSQRLLHQAHLEVDSQNVLHLDISANRAICGTDRQTDIHLMFNSSIKDYYYYNTTP